MLQIKEKLGRVRAKRGTAGTVATVADKAFQLLQVALGRLRIEAAGASGMAAFSLRMETRATAEVSRASWPAAAVDAAVSTALRVFMAGNEAEAHSCWGAAWQLGCVDTAEELRLPAHAQHSRDASLGSLSRASFSPVLPVIPLRLQLAARIAKAFNAFCLTPETRCALAPIGHVAARALARSLWPEEAPDRLLLQLVSRIDRLRYHRSVCTRRALPPS